ncbi:MAG: hypothetical protein LGB71_02770 [Sulfurovum sp.]|nr:hypothetical protein [Sulfurovum sp.]MCB4775471.1 hypothetical protein [Sulfurovum sp.]
MKVFLSLLTTIALFVLTGCVGIEAMSENTTQTGIITGAVAGTIIEYNTKGHHKGHHAVLGGLSGAVAGGLVGNEIDKDNSQIVNAGGWHQ